MSKGQRKHLYSKLLALSRAREAAVQALYQIEISKKTPNQVLEEFYEYHFVSKEDKISSYQLHQDSVDVEHFKLLIENIYNVSDQLDQLISGKLKKGWKVTQLDRVLHAILRAGIFEIVSFKQIPVKVILDEYTNIAHNFLNEKQTAFVNSVLDRIAHENRSEAFPIQQKQESLS